MRIFLLLKLTGHLEFLFELAWDEVKLDIEHKLMKVHWTSNLAFAQIKHLLAVHLAGHI